MTTIANEVAKQMPQPETLWTALLAAQAEAPALQRDGLNPHFKSKYLTLETLVEKVLPVLNRHGLVLVQAPEQDGDGDPVLDTKIIHAATGESVSNSCKLYLGKEDMQGYGSAITYARRYGLMAVLGLVADADDDGNATVKRAEPKPAEKEFAPKSWKALNEALTSLFGEAAAADFTGFGAEALTHLYGDAELTKEQKDALWQYSVTAARYLHDHITRDFPPPTRDEMRLAWREALGDAGEDTFLEGPAWRMSPDEKDREPKT